MQKRLMILGTLFEMTELVKKAKARGCYTVVCDGNADGPARTWADRDYVADVRDVDRIAEICKKEKINAIITSFSDIMFEMMVRIADRAGIPCYAVPAMLPAYRDKQVTKKICRELGLHVPEFRRTKAEEWLPGSGSGKEGQEPWNIFPAVIKPVNSYGSRGLQVVWSPEEIREWFRRTDPELIHGEALLESVSRGQELNVQAAVVDGTVQLLSVADRMTAELDRNTIRVNYANIYPSRYFDQAAPVVTEILQKYTEKTGQKQGPVAMQCFWDGTNIEIGEIAARFFGFEHELTEYTTGLSLEDYLLDLVCSPDHGRERLRGHNPRGSGCAAGIYLTSVRPGKIENQDSVLELARQKETVGFHPFYKEGDEVGRFGPAPYYARCYLRTENRAQMDAKICAVMKKVHAFGENGQELLFRPDLQESALHVK
jgi:formate-dependent phosphoribosylglycinamide formyltransferase (GAR transformylase)